MKDDLNNSTSNVCQPIDSFSFRLTAGSDATEQSHSLQFEEIYWFYRYEKNPPKIPLNETSEFFILPLLVW